MVRPSLRVLPKAFLAIACGCFATGRAVAQGQWVWEAGSSDVWPVAGGIGVFGPGFTPAKRYAGAAWTDSTGKFWLYGAQAYSDLWCFDPALEQWALMNGTLTTGLPPVYGTMGTPGPTVTPGQAEFGHPSWATASGTLWMYGNNSSTDMWRWDIALGQWAWMNGYGGANPPVYGVQGIPAAANTPGNVNETDCHWVDGNGDLWLFNDMAGVMWKYDTGLNQWAWMSGTPGGAQSLGPLGVFSASNQPGANSNCPMMGTLWCMWQDSGDGLWMIYNIDQGANVAAQIWKYDIGLGQWACMRVDVAPYGAFVQSTGVQCVEDATHAPAARGELRMRWVDDCDQLWTYAGVPMCSPSSYFADLWRYDPATNNWTWVKDAFNATVNLGVQGIPAPTNRPDPNAGAFVWRNEQGFWMFGGNSNSNDAGNVFHYLPDPVAADFSFAVDSAACQQVAFTDLSTTGCNKVKERIWDFGDPASGANNTSSAANPTHDYTSSGTFTVTLIVKNCTWDADTIQQQVTIACTTTVTLVGDTICAGECTTLNALVLGGTPPYTFVWDNGITATNGGPITVCPASTTTYTVIATDGLGASDTSLATITVIAPPVVDLGEDTVLCAPPVQLDAGNAGSTFTWQNGSAGQTFSASASGLYWVEVDNGVCATTDSIEVTITGPSVDLGPDTVTCFPAMLLDAGNAGLDHVWQDGSMNGMYFTNGAGTYWVTVTDQNGCAVSDTIVIALDVMLVDLGPDLFACEGESLVLDAGSGWGGYTWQDGSTGQALAVVVDGDYWVQTALGQCSGADTVHVDLYRPEAIALVSDTAGCPPLTVLFNDGSTTPYGSLVSWEWGFGDGGFSGFQNASHMYDVPGIYTASLVVVTSDGCVDTVVVEPSILIHPVPGANFQYSPPTAELMAATIHFTDSSVGAVSWEWDFGDGTSSTEQHPVHNYTAAGTYTVTLTVTNEFGCEAVVEYTLIITETSSIYVPNAFTPNSDGINDLFFVQGTGITDLELLIFNRWGEMIFSSAALSNGWDGTYGGRDVQDGVYEYKVRYRVVDQQGWAQAIGHVTVLR